MAEVEGLHRAPESVAEAESTSGHLEQQNGSQNHGEGHWQGRDGDVVEIRRTGFCRARPYASRMSTAVALPSPLIASGAWASSVAIGVPRPSLRTSHATR
jgi:hypothetical protein